MWLIFSFLIICSIYNSLAESDVPKNGKNEFAFYYPLTAVSEQPTKVCLAIDKDLLPAKVKTKISNITCEENTCEPHDVNSDFSCWDIKIPKPEQNVYTPFQIALEIETKDPNVKFSGEDQIRITKGEHAIFIETDRNTYKMGDTVKIRLLVLGFDLKPIKDYKISSLKVRSPYPSSAVVKEWENISTESGLAQLEFQLAPDTPEGYWTISGDGVYAGFKVEKYILPRFQASINGPDRISNFSKSISYSVCGKYSYGRNVKGVALLAIKVNRGYQQEATSLSQVKELKGGCADYEIFTDDLYLNNQTAWSIDITGTVTEEGTDQVENSNKYAYISRDPYSYQWNEQSRYIKPELPFIEKFSLTDVNVLLKSRLIELCYKEAWKENTVCNNFTLDSSNSIEFTIPPLKNISGYNNLQIEAKLIEYPLSYNPSRYLTVWHSTSNNAVKILKEEPNSVDCGSTLTFTVLYNSGYINKGENIEFKYILSSRGEILSVGSVVDTPKKENFDLDEYPNVIGKENYDKEVENSVDQFKLKIQLDKKIYAQSKLIVYYVYNNEVISDIVDIEVKQCTPNKVEAKWAKSPLYPGEIGTLNIEADSNSLCSITSIDKASKFLGSSERININNVLNRFNRYTYLHRKSCIKPEGVTEEPSGRFSYDYSSQFDSYEALKDSQVGAISNMKFISKICEKQSYVIPLGGGGVYATAVRPFLSSAAPAAIQPESGVNKVSDVAVDNRGSAIRSFFPETWLWDLIHIAENGRATVERKLPDSITDWVGNVLCVSSNKGFGLSENIEMKGFKPFFVDILLPYSIKRNKEILHLPVPIFNYLNYSLPIRITLETGEDLVLMDGEDKKSFSMCLGAENSFTHNYRVKATKLGYVNITVAAHVDPAYAENCAPESVIRRRDVVQKPILVEPEGYPSAIIKSALLCANDSAGTNKIEWNIVLPKDIVPDTVDGKVIINSDILGPMFQNLENILVVPTGCGEQTMATLTPNLYVLKYLEANNALTDKIKEKILKNLEIGYQRMLNYVHDDGSFSAFGKTDGNGSMFLTAFVIRTFKQMQKYIFIDDDVLNKAITWIISHQMENGCFDPVHHVFHEMGLASSKNQTTALTSYVAISFLETNTKIDDKIISNAKKCITNENTLDKYTLAISSYALGLMGMTEDVEKRLNKLLEISNSKDDLTWWAQSATSLSANVEVSGYVVMSLLQQNPVENLGTAGSIVRWLQSQMNPRGGFFSTTDTVVGLDAISRYAGLVNKKEPNVKISLSTKTDAKNIEITKRDRTKPIILPLTSYPNEIKAKIQGDGCVSIQANVNYYLDKPLTTDDLKLDIQLKPVNQRLKCSLIELKPCVSYTTPGQINMAIVEVTMPSGFAPDQASLYELTSSNVVKKFEQIRNQVVFYLTQLSANEVCMPFKIEENLIVENVANATVKLYDYYKPELSISKSFRLEDCEANLSVPA